MDRLNQSSGNKSTMVDNYLKYQSQVREILNDEPEEGTKTFHQHLDQILNKDSFKRVIEILSLILSLSSFLIYVVSTYFREEKFRWFIYYSYGACSYFNLETLLNLYLAQHRLLYLIQIDTLIDLGSSIPPYLGKISNGAVKKIVEISHSLLVFRITRFIKKNLKINENDVTRHIIVMILTFFNLIIFATCIMRIAEIDNLNYYIMNPDFRNSDFLYQVNFHDFLYYIFITLVTVGYGDIYPLTELGRIVILMVVLFVIYLVPKSTTELINLLENYSIYSRAFYKANSEIPHLVICGNVGVDALKNFCNELFHVDHGQIDKNVIILSQEMPSQKMRLFLHAGKYELNLRYLKGYPLSENDLERTDILSSKACIIETDKYTTDPHSTDHENILIALAIKKYFLQKQMPDPPLFIQLIKPENKIHYQSALQSLFKNNKCSNDQVIIIEEIKMNLLSKSCLIPGIIPMITNLVRSSGSSDETEIIWLNEYLEGTGHEIYRASLNESFKNNTFCQISQIIYEKYDAVAFALEIEVEGKTMISLNPGPFYIEKFIDERDDVKFYIYVICSDKEVADSIEKGTEKEEQQVDEEDNIEAHNEVEHPKTEMKFGDYMSLKLEDIQHLDENNEISNEPAEEEDDYFIIKNFVNNNVDVKKDSIRNSSIYRNHIVVCGTHPSLYYYILPLRAKYLGRENLKYVVILTQDMPKDLWDSISRFENIILINGSPLEIEDLYRANIEYADKVVILENEGSKLSSDNNQMVDSETIFIYKAIKKCNPNIQIMTELIFDTNIEFLLSNEELAQLDSDTVSYESTSVFSAGEVYISSIIDTLTCQAYYNKHIVTIIHQLLTGGKNSSNSTLRSICENVGLKSSNLWQMNIPEKFINKTFLDLYSEFCEKNLIALGLYRLPGARDNTSPYVYTKPDRDTRLTHRDKIFVLGIEPIQNYRFDDEDNKVAAVPFGESSFDKDKEENDLGRRENIINDDYSRNIKFTPFSYLEEMISELENQAKNLGAIVDRIKGSVKESISSGIRQEISSILH